MYKVYATLENEFGSFNYKYETPLVGGKDSLQPSLNVLNDRLVEHIKKFNDRLTGSSPRPRRALFVVEETIAHCLQCFDDNEGWYTIEECSSEKEAYEKMRESIIADCANGMAGDYIYRVVKKEEE